jgi:hypothetical protein
MVHSLRLWLLRRLLLSLFHSTPPACLNRADLFALRCTTLLFDLPLPQEEYDFFLSRLAHYSTRVSNGFDLGPSHVGQVSSGKGLS